MNVDIEAALGLATFIVGLIAAIAATVIAYLALRHTARPRVRVDYRGEALTGRMQFVPDEEVELRFEVSNLGRLYAKPAATDLKLYVNFDPVFEPSEIRFGSQLERTENVVRRGKGGSKYLVAQGIHLFYGEPGEDIVARTKLPSTVGRHPGWIAAFSREGSHDVHKFSVDVKHPDAKPLSGLRCQEGRRMHRTGRGAAARQQVTRRLRAHRPLTSFRLRVTAEGCTKHLLRLYVTMTHIA